MNFSWLNKKSKTYFTSILFFVVTTIPTKVLAVSAFDIGSGFSSLSNFFAHPIATLTGTQSLTSLSLVSGVILWVFNWILWLTNIIFNGVIFITINNFNSFIKDLKVIEVGWTASRDLANMFFIFILLYLAIGTILQLSGVQTKKTLVSIIIVALLINFSATFTRVAIDASNITALTFYNLISESPDKGVDLSTLFQQSISFFVGQNPIIPQEIINAGSQGTGSVVGNFILGLISNSFIAKDVAIVAKNILVFILMIIIILTLILIIFMFLTRALSLIILLITAPLAFLGFIFSPLKEISTMWIGRLKCDILFPPIFMFVLYITFSIFKNTLIITQDGSIASQIITLFLINGLLISGVIISQRVCKLNFGFDQKLIKKQLGKVSGFAGRNTIGLVGKKVNESAYLKNKFAQNKATRLLATGVSRVATKAENAGFGSGTGYAASLEARRKQQRAIYDRLDDENNPAQAEINRSRLTSNLLFSSDREALYRSLSAEDRAKLERGVDSNPNLNDEEKTKLVAVLRDLRNALKGKDKEDTNTELGKLITKEIRFGRDTDGRFNKVVENLDNQIERFAKLNDPELQKMAYKNMSDQDKIIFEKEAEKLANTPITLANKDAVEAAKKVSKAIVDPTSPDKGLRKQLSDNDTELGQKLDKLQEEFETKEKKEEKKTREKTVVTGINEYLDTIKTTGTTTLTQPQIDLMFNDLINTLSIDQISTLSPEILKQDNMVKLLEGNVVSKIYANNKDLNTPDWEEIKRKIKTPGIGTASANAFLLSSPVGSI